ncbi:uncharacterized protein LOC106139193 [Amyelois transitella]|uniref:uncharacterized protein LOC106139193 n=1 Tax=Amyelois transitella TaxID=680683 RepID=UPI00067CDB68|nr:uncharacterized protein LOC106139193 [Amyelois transitella]
MLLLALSAALAVAAAAPASYDQRQDGDFNVRADLQNVVLLIALPKKMPVSSDFLDLFRKNVKHNELQDRADHVMDAFVEPSTPYRVEIGTDRSSDGDGRAVEVVIAGRRHGSVESEDTDSREYKLVGAMEQCGPDMERDPDTLACRAKLPDRPPEPQDSKLDDPATAVQPEVIPVA